MPTPLAKPAASQSLRPLAARSNRLAAWRKARSLWQNRMPDPAKEMERLRQEAERELPSLY